MHDTDPGKLNEEFHKMSEELNSLLEKHKQLQQRSIFKTIYETQEQPNNSDIVQNQNIQNYYNPVYFVPQENWLQPVSQFPPSQYLNLMPTSYNPYSFIPTMPQPLVYSQLLTFPQPVLPPLPSQLPSPPPPPPPPAPSPQTSTSSGKVYVNPNYNRKIVYENSHLQMNPSIHVNPKLMPNATKPPIQFEEGSNPSASSNLIKKLVPKALTNKKTEGGLSSYIGVTAEACDKTISEKVQNNKSSSSMIETCLSNNTVKSGFDITLVDINEPLKYSSKLLHKKSSLNSIEPETIVVKNSNVSKENHNSNLFVLSQRKLVRIQKNSEKKLTVPYKTLTKRKLSVNDMKKSRISQNKLTLRNPCKISKIDNSKLIKSNWYSKMLLKKKLSPKKTLSNSTGIVSIGGIEYTTSRNQLIRNCPIVSSIKKKKNLSSITSRCYDVETGAELIEVELPENKFDNSFESPEKLNTSLQSFKTSISNKVKQRSLQILRKKLGKNNQPCLFFQRYGYCANQLNCSKVHDKKRVAVCGNFLQGKCLSENCLLSHDVGREKMPVCKYFLDGCCSRDECPYPHEEVEVPSKNRICFDFLQGYCRQGNECPNIHTRQEFDRSGICRKGKYCQYPHKSIFSSSCKSFRKSTQHKSNAFKAKQTEVKSTELQTVAFRKRYYNSGEDLSETKEKLLSQGEPIKNVDGTKSSNCSEINDNNVKGSETRNIHGAKVYKETLDVSIRKSKRSPIGPLPAYIPIE